MPKKKRLKLWEGRKRFQDVRRREVQQQMSSETDAGNIELEPEHHSELKPTSLPREDELSQKELNPYSVPHIDVKSLEEDFDFSHTTVKEEAEDEYDKMGFEDPLMGDMSEVKEELGSGYDGSFKSEEIYIKEEPMEPMQEPSNKEERRGEKRRGHFRSQSPDLQSNKQRLKVEEDVNVKDGPKYDKSGVLLDWRMTTAQATRYHAVKLGLSGDLCGLANTSLNPSSKSIDHMRRRWLQNEHGGFNDTSVINSIKKYAKVNPNLTIEVETYEDSYCVALVTPFMKRVHSEFREACEVVFVDAAGCVDQMNTTVVPLLCAGPAGAAPLAVLFTSAQDEAILTRGFNLVKKAVGAGAFYGKGTPQCFMTDNCDAKRKALSTTWPEARLFLCIFHLQQQVWRWLLDSKHGIRKEHRQELMTVMKKMVYAKCTTEFSQVLEEFQCSSLADTYPRFKSYLHELVERKEEWALAFRAGMMLPGHHTNNFCESTICIIKDIVLNRCKAYNTAQLLVFMAEVFDDYMKQRLVEVALGRQCMKLVGTLSTIPTEMVTHVGGALYEVQSQSTQGCIYSVDLTVGSCTCTVGENGAPCNHLVAAAEYSMSAVPQVLTLSAENRRWLAGVALGQEKLPDESFLRGLQEEVSREMVIGNEIIPTMPRESEDLEEQQRIPYPHHEEALQHRPLNFSGVAEMLQTVVKQFGNDETKEALKRLQKTLSSIKTTNQLNSLLHNMCSQTTRGSGGRKTCVQPT